MHRWAILEWTGYRYDYKTEIEAPTMWQARKIAADYLGGIFCSTGRDNPPKRKFRVRLEA